MDIYLTTDLAFEDNYAKIPEGHKYDLSFLQVIALGFTKKFGGSLIIRKYTSINDAYTYGIYWNREIGRYSEEEERIISDGSNILLKIRKCLKDGELYFPHFSISEFYIRRKLLETKSGDLLWETYYYYDISTNSPNSRLLKDDFLVPFTEYVKRSYSKEKDSNFESMEKIFFWAQELCSYGLEVIQELAQEEK